MQVLEKLLKIKNADILEGIVTENHLTTLSGETTLEEARAEAIQPTVIAEDLGKAWEE